ncbi:MAG TPA: hypothetical protein VFC47_15500 [Caulobacteraceae bacterium]|nr:hypothetical protein [Caulobacteraceae bacterium]
MKFPVSAEPAPTAAARSYCLSRRASALAAGALALCGCATVVLGAHEPFEIVSSPAGAHVDLSTGETCVTPCKLELPRAVAFQARVSMPGYATQVIDVASRANVGGAVGFLHYGDSAFNCKTRSNWRARFARICVHCHRNCRNYVTKSGGGRSEY